LKARLTLIAALGLGLAVYLFLHIGWGAVFSTVIVAGWSGLATLCFFALGQLLLLGSACYVLRPPSSEWKLWIPVWSRMVRDSASEVLPFAQIGGLVLGARAAILCGVPTPDAFAALIADIATEMLAQIAYLAVGVAIVAAQLSPSPTLSSLVSSVVTSLGMATAAGALFLSLPRYADSVLKKVISRFLPDAVAVTTAASASLRAIYRSRVRMTLSIALHFAAWIASAFGAWIAFRLMHARITFASVLAIESLVAVSRIVAAIVPNALGVQEAAYTVITPLFGIGAEFGLAVSLLKRARDVVVGVPILLIWQVSEGQRLVARSQTQD
jgi:glycosyltransferase 2 family protein